MVLTLNCTQTDSPEALPSSYELSVHIPLTILHCVDILLAVILNITVLRFFIIGRIKKSPFNILLMNLAIGDLVTAVGFIPFVTVSSINLRNISQTDANYLCTITEGKTIFWTGNAVSAFTIMVVCVHRYIGICKPLHRTAFYVKKVKLSYSCIVVVWLSAIIINIPNVLSRQYQPCLAYCERVWPEHLNQTSFAVASVLIGLFIPLSLMVFCFLSAVHSFKKSVMDETYNPNIVRKRKRVLKILGLLIIAYIICWLPFSVHWIITHLTDIFPSGSKGHFIEAKVSYITLLFGLANTVINPLVYGFRLTNIRVSTKRTAPEDIAPPHIIRLG